MSREYIIRVPDDAGFVEYSYIRGGRKYNTHYAYKSMERLVRCKECKWCDDAGKKRALICTNPYIDVDPNPNFFCGYGEREGE